MADLYTAGQGIDFNFSGPNDIQASGSGNQTVSGDDGSANHNRPGGRLD